MKQKTVSISTLGCKVNHQESEKLAADFQNLGFALAKPGDPADVCIINSCTVTSTSDAKTRQRIRQARSKNPQALLCVIGCLPEVSRETVSSMKEVNLIIGSQEKDQTAALVSKALNGNGSFLCHRDGTLDTLPLASTPLLSGRTRAFLKAEDGCDQYCAYCIIPHARGSVRSRPEADVLAEASALLVSGYHEIVLTGINLARYGADFPAQNNTESSGIVIPGKCNVIPAKAGISGRTIDSRLRGNDECTLPLYGLLKTLTRIDAGYKYRIRLGSLEPNVIGASEARAIATLPRICPHFHLSLQSGSNRTLERMGRHYNTQDYQEILTVLREIDPHFAVTTDVIVGFPGETEQDFTESLAFVESAGFAKVHVFPYSARSGTPAAGMPKQVSEPLKKARAAAMLAAANKGAAAFLDACTGETRRTLSFGPDKTGRIRGLTDNGIDIRIPATNKNAGTAPENEFFGLLLTPEVISGCES